MIELADVHKSFGKVEVLQGHHRVGRKRRGRLHHRPVGLRQVDHPALHQRARRLRPRRHPHRRRARRPQRALIKLGPDPDLDGVPALQPVSAPDRARERHRGADLCEGQQARGGGAARARAVGAGGLGGKADVYPAATFRRAACSASRLRVRSQCSRRRSCSTSRPRRSIPNWSARCSAVMRTLADDGMTMVVVTHEMALCARTSRTACCSSTTAGSRGGTGKVGPDHAATCAHAGISAARAASPLRLPS